MFPAIETNQIVKRYGQVTAIDRLSLQVNQGEIYAFLGLNGAGKTTTIRLLLGMIRPTAGQVWVLGRAIEPGKEKLWADVGYLVETADAYPELTVRENLEVMRRLRPGTQAAAVDEAIERLGLAEYAGRRAGALSHGNKQRLGLAKALLHRPRLVILDEPANGLDPAGIVEIRHLLQSLARDQGVTVFMSSHILGEVARLADRVGIIHQGRLQQELSAAELAANRRQRLLLRAVDNEAMRQLLNGAGFAAGPPANGYVELSELAVIERPEALVSLLAEASLPPSRVNVEQEDLEQYFLRLVGQDGGQ